MHCTKCPDGEFVPDPTHVPPAGSVQRSVCDKCGYKAFLATAALRVPEPRAEWPESARVIHLPVRGGGRE